MSTHTASQVKQERTIGFRRVLPAALLAIVVATAANLVIYWTAAAIFPGVRQFPMLSTALVVASTVTYLVLAFLVFLIVSRLSRQPARHFRIVAIAALILSFGAPLSAGAGFMEGTRADTPTVVTLLLMHILSAAVTIRLLTGRTVEQG